MSHKPNGDAVWQALNLAFYALTEELEQAGVLDQDKLKKQEKKIEDGEITCNVDNPEDCESCSG